MAHRHMTQPYVLSAATATGKTPSGMGVSYINYPGSPLGGGSSTLRYWNTVPPANQGGLPPVWEEDPIWVAQPNIGLYGDIHPDPFFRSGIPQECRVDCYTHTVGYRGSRQLNSTQIAAALAVLNAVGRDPYWYTFAIVTWAVVSLSYTVRDPETMPHSNRDGYVLIHTAAA